MVLDFVTVVTYPNALQKYIAMETLQVFAPLARLLGMYRIKVGSPSGPFHVKSQCCLW